MKSLFNNLSKRPYMLLAVMVVTALSACTFGVPIGQKSVDSGNVSQVKKSKSGNPSSYVVMGKRYYVLDSSQGFVQRGLASWYGKKFHGRKTSSGEVYNMYAMTAAHKSLPLPTFVRVQNLSNGRSIVVKVNDRGPFVGDRIIDLSYTAAEKLGVIGPGTARVEVSAVNSGQQDAARPVIRTIPLKENVAADVPLFIQMGSFGSVINAQNLLRELHDANEKAARMSQLQTTSGLFYRVRVGPLFDIEEANAVILRLNNKGFSASRIVVQE